MNEVEAEYAKKRTVSENASYAAKPVSGDRTVTDPSPRPAEPPSAAAFTEQKAAAMACDGDTTAREDKATPRRELPSVVINEQKDNQVQMSDASTSCTKRPC